MPQQRRDFFSLNQQNHSSPSQPTDSQPIFLLPKVVMIMGMTMLVIHAAYEFSLDAEGKYQVWIWLGFIPARLLSTDIVGGYLPLLWTPITHAFLHGDWTHVFMNVAWLAIFGTPVARRYGNFSFILVFLAGVLGGVALYAALQINSGSVLIGASGGVAGLTGAAMRFMFQPVQIARDPETGEVTAMGRRLGNMVELWSNSSSRMFIIFWVGINLAVPVYAMMSAGGGPQIAWQAHIGGFVVGLMMPSLIEKILLKSSNRP